MKKLVFLVILAVVTALAGCNQTSSKPLSNNAGPKPTAIVKNLYKASVNDDQKEAGKILAHYHRNTFSSNERKGLMEDLQDQVKNAGGLKKVSLRELKREALKKEVVSDLDDDFGKNWTTVIVKMPGQEYMSIWILKNADNTCYIVENDDLGELSEIKK